MKKRIFLPIIFLLFTFSLFAQWNSTGDSKTTGNFTMGKRSNSSNIMRFTIIGEENRSLYAPREIMFDNGSIGHTKIQSLYSDGRSRINFIFDHPLIVSGDETVFSIDKTELRSYKPFRFYNPALINNKIKFESSKYTDEISIFRIDDLGGIQSTLNINLGDSSSLKSYFRITRSSPIGPLGLFLVTNWGETQTNGNSIVWGKIGIKNANPAYELDVTGTGRVTSNMLVSGRMGVKNTSPAYDLDVTGTGRVTNNMLVSGRMGIKTTNPIYDLDVYGTAKIAGNLYLTPDLSGVFNVYGFKLYLGKENENGDPIWIARYNKSLQISELRINIGNNMNGDDSFVLGTNSANVWKPFFTVKNNGKVGIGTNNPQNALDVNGIIRATEVIIETEWADFVFAKDYKLPDLMEIENHINEFGHLPGIPSETEAKDNGIGLSEITTKLLQKIEELTLYTIQQEKRLQKQEEIIRELQNKSDNKK